MSMYRKKPVVVEAHQWTGSKENAAPIVDWITHRGGQARFVPAQEFLRAGNGEVVREARSAQIQIRTLEGRMAAEPLDFVICGVAGEFYPCKPDIFRASYDPAGGEL